MSKTFEFQGTLPRCHTDAIGSLECTYDTNMRCWKAFTASWDQSLAVWITPEVDPPAESGQAKNSLRKSFTKPKLKKQSQVPSGLLRDIVATVTPKHDTEATDAESAPDDSQDNETVQAEIPDDKTAIPAPAVTGPPPKPAVTGEPPRPDSLKSPRNAPPPVSPRRKVQETNETCGVPTRGRAQASENVPLILSITPSMLVLPTSPRKVAGAPEVDPKEPGVDPEENGTTPACEPEAQENEGEDNEPETTE